MKKIILIILLLLIILSGYIFLNHKKNEAAAFDYAKEFVMTQYNESGTLTSGGTRYDFGRGNYFVIVQNQQDDKFYLEVKISDNRSLVSIEDNTSNVEGP